MRWKIRLHEVPSRMATQRRQSHLPYVRSNGLGIPKSKKGYLRVFNPVFRAKNSPRTGCFACSGAICLVAGAGFEPTTSGLCTIA